MRTRRANGFVRSMLIVATLLVMASVGPIVQAGSSPPVKVHLRVTPTFDPLNSTLLAGHVEVPEAKFRHPLTVGNHALTLPGGVLTVCPANTQKSGVIAQLRALQDKCSGGTNHTNPTVLFGPRTWLQYVGEFAPTGPLPSTFGTFAAPEALDPSWAFVLGNETLGLRIDAGEVRFAPTVSSSRVVVLVGTKTTTYNGTAFHFLFRPDTPGATDVAIVAQGVWTNLTQARPHVTMGPGNPKQVAHAFDPRILVDLHEAAFGPESRVPLTNLTRLLEDTRNAAFLNGALLGRLNGTIGPFDLTRRPHALVQFHELDVTVGTGGLEGSGTVHVLLVDDGASFDGASLVHTPWTFMVVLWIVALLALVLGFARGAPVKWERVADVASVVLVLYLSHRIITDLLGINPLDSGSYAGYSARVPLQTASFELLALAASSVALFVPLRSIVRRVTPARFRFIAAPIAAVAYLVYVSWKPAGLVALGLLFGRL